MAGNAVLSVANGGFVSVGQFTVASGGRVELAGGLLRTSQFSANNGEITGAGELSLQLAKYGEQRPTDSRRRNSPIDGFFEHVHELRDHFSDGATLSSVEVW